MRIQIGEEIIENANVNLNGFPAYLTLEFAPSVHTFAEIETKYLGTITLTNAVMCTPEKILSIEFISALVMRIRYQLTVDETIAEELQGNINDNESGIVELADLYADLDERLKELEHG